MNTRRPCSQPCVTLAALVALGGVACREQVIVGDEPKLAVAAASVRDAGADARPSSQDDSDPLDDQMQGDQMQSEPGDGQDSSDDGQDSNDDSEDTRDIETD
jgi:hypothetical protein